MAIGTAFRFSNLGALELSPDEGASWAAASSPTCAEVIARQPALNPGELPIHDLMLHGWIAAFGSSVAAMRSMSALLGVACILLVFIVTLELFSPESDGSLSRDDAALLAAVASLVFAVNLVTIKYSREARMYPLMLAAILAQVTIFHRALRLGGIANYVGVVILSALAIGSNFAAVLIPAIEGLWLLYLLARSGWRPDSELSRRAWTIAILLGVAGLVLAPKLFTSLHAASIGSVGGWRKLPALYEPLALFNKATGSFGFPVLACLAAWGVVAGWRAGARDAIAFALLWMWAPPILMVVASYAISPVFVERYALSCFVPFFILAAVRIFELPGDLLRAAALAIAIAVSIGHIVSYDRKPHDAQYREAIAAASSSLKPGETMTVVPAYAIQVLRYYLPADRQSRAVRYDSSSSAAVLILGDQNLPPDAAESYRKDYPNEVARVRGVTVLRK